MSVIIWPADLPQLMRVDGYGESAPDGRLRQKMDAGPDKVRLRSSAAVRPVRARLRLDFDGKARLERFWTEETARGVLPFLFPVPALDGAGLWAADGSGLLTDDGAPLLLSGWWLVQFGNDPIAYEPINRVRFGASFALDVMP